jgi:hypothetical protein
MSLRGHSTISRTYGANWLAESKGLIASGLITIKIKRGMCQAFSSRFRVWSPAIFTAICRSSSFVRSLAGLGRRNATKHSAEKIYTYSFFGRHGLLYDKFSALRPYVGRILQHSFATLDLRGPREVTGPSFSRRARIKSFAPRAPAASRYSPRSAAPHTHQQLSR